MSKFPDDFGQLVDPFPRVVVVCGAVFGAEVAPLEAIDGAKVALASMTQAAFLEELLGAVSVPYLDS